MLERFPESPNHSEVVVLDVETIEIKCFPIASFGMKLKDHRESGNTNVGIYQQRGINGVRSVSGRPEPFER